MLRILKSVICLGLVAALTAGCQQDGTPVANTPTDQETRDYAQGDDDHEHAGGGHDEGESASADSKVSAALSQLSPEDRQLADAQRYCAVMNQSLLGSMGTPVKLDVKGEPIFICCAGCKGKALRNPEETLANVAKLQADNASHQ